MRQIRKHHSSRSCSAFAMVGKKTDRDSRIDLNPIGNRSSGALSMIDC